MTALPLAYGPAQETLAMHIVYIDEPGDTGSRTGSGSQTYTLATVTVPAARWSKVSDEAVKFRRDLRRRSGLAARLRSRPPG